MRGSPGRTRWCIISVIQPKSVIFGVAVGDSRLQLESGSLSDTLESRNTKIDIITTIRCWADLLVATVVCTPVHTCSLAVGLALFHNFQLGWGSSMAITNFTTLLTRRCCGNWEGRGWLAAGAKVHTLCTPCYGLPIKVHTPIRPGDVRCLKDRKIFSW